MLAADGRCKALDSRADGYGRAEGCVVHLLTSRVDAMSADEVSPVVVISGSAALQDGRSSSLTAPNGPAQQQVVRAALRAARLSSDAIHVVEMHGTGTALGDPIEVVVFFHASPHLIVLGGGLCRSIARTDEVRGNRRDRGAMCLSEVKHGSFGTVRGSCWSRVSHCCASRYGGGRSKCAAVSVKLCTDALM